MLKLLLGIIGLLACACEPINAYFGMEDDNLVEESSEALIYYQFHVPIDLTPSSPEK